MRNLLWKEWHEQSWKLAFGCVVLSAIAITGLRSRMVADADLIDDICFLGATMLPILSSTGLVPAERAAGSFESLLAMPIAPWRILFAKTMMGCILCAGPIMVAAIVTLLMVGGREITSGVILNLYFRTACTTLSLFIWMLALTIRLPSETRAGLIAVGTWFLWSLITGGLFSGPGIHSYFFLTSPFAFLLEFTPRPNPGTPLALILVTQFFVLAIVWTVALHMLVRPVEGHS